MYVTSIVMSVLVIYGVKVSQSSAQWQYLVRGICDKGRVRDVYRAFGDRVAQIWWDV